MADSTCPKAYGGRDQRRRAGCDGCCRAESGKSTSVLCLPTSLVLPHISSCLRQVSLWRLIQVDDDDSLHMEVAAEAFFDECPETLALSLDWNDRVGMQCVVPSLRAKAQSGHASVSSHGLNPTDKDKYRSGGELC